MEFHLSSALGYSFSQGSSLSFSFLFFSLAIPWFGLLSQVNSLRLSSGHSGPVLTLSNAARTSLFSPHLLVVDVNFWATSPLGVAVRHLICGFCLLIFSSQLCCPLRPQNSPTEPLVRGFPGVWKLLLFYYSLPHMGLHP